MPDIYGIMRRQDSVAEQQSRNSTEDSLSVTRDVQGTTSFKATGKYADGLLPAARNTFGTIAQQCIASGNQRAIGAQLAQGPKHLGPKGRHPVTGPVGKVPCRYGDKCKNRKCTYQHPDPKQHQQAPKQTAAAPNKWRGLCEKQSAKITKLTEENKKLTEENKKMREYITSLEARLRPDQSQEQQSVDSPGQDDQDDQGDDLFDRLDAQAD